MWIVKKVFKTDQCYVMSTRVLAYKQKSSAVVTPCAQPPDVIGLHIARTVRRF